MRIGSEKHEQVLAAQLMALEKEGYRTFDLKGFSPDAIAVKDGKVIAVEVLQQNYRVREGRKEIHSRWTFKGKRNQYSMFDDVFIVTYIKDPPTPQ